MSSDDITFSNVALASVFIGIGAALLHMLIYARRGIYVHDDLLTNILITGVIATCVSAFICLVFVCPWVIIPLLLYLLCSYGLELAQIDLLRR